MARVAAVTKLSTMDSGNWIGIGPSTSSTTRSYTQNACGSQFSPTIHTRLRWMTRTVRVPSPLKTAPGAYVGAGGVKTCPVSGTTANSSRKMYFLRNMPPEHCVNGEARPVQIASWPYPQCIDAKSGKMFQGNPKD